MSIFKVVINLDFILQIDKNGRVIDLEKNKSKIQTIEKEFIRAEKAEMRTLKDEEDIKNNVRLEKLNCLENCRKTDRILKLKDDKKLAKGNS